MYIFNVNTLMRLADNDENFRFELERELRYNQILELEKKEKQEENTRKALEEKKTSAEKSTTFSKKKSKKHSKDLDKITLAAIVFTR